MDVFYSGVKIIFILLVTATINWLAKRFVAKALPSALALKDNIARIDKKREETLLKIFSNTLSLIIWLAAILMILPELGVNISALLAGVGVVGLAIGMGARKVIEDYIAGFFIILENHYRVGDEIKIVGVEGKVIDINFRRTILRDKQGEIHLIPHSQIKITSRKTNNTL